MEAVWFSVVPYPRFLNRWWVS